VANTGLDLAGESLDDCQDRADIKPATEASGSSSGSPFDAVIPKFRKPDVIDHHSSTYRADVVAGGVSGSSEEALKRMTVPTCTQQEDAGARSLYKPNTYALEKVSSDVIPRKAFSPTGSKRREFLDAVGLSSHHMPFTGPTNTSELPQTHPTARSGIRSDRSAGPSDPPISTTSGLAEPTTCAMLPTMEPHIDAYRRESSDFFPRR
jgi:hypothetical protein